MKLKTLNLIIISLCLSVTGCSFVEDRSQDPVQIVDASQAQSSNSIVESQPEKPLIKSIQYRVVQNDTLGIIAEKTMGSASLYKQLADFNQLDYQQPLKIGQLLLIPESNFSRNATTRVQPLKRPSTAASLPQQSTDFADMDTLIAEKQYNQAIDWALTHPEIDSNQQLQNKLAAIGQQQADLELTEKDYSEARFLIDGLIKSGHFNAENNAQLQTKSKQIQCQELSHNAATKSSKGQTPDAYNDLLKAYQLDSQYTAQLTDFLSSREQVTESMHQQALKLYRDQQLDSALTIWNKILAIKPNDDLALVYKDRVNNLKKRLDGI